MSGRALVVAAEAPAPPAGMDGSVIIAADSGLDAALAHGLVVDLVVGDLDSATPALVADYEANGGVVERHPATKDESDLELALAAALARGCDKIHVLLADGGRLDHALANLAVIASPRWAKAEVSATIGRNRAWVVRGFRPLALPVGSHIALQAMGGSALGVTTTGVEYPLSDERLDPFVARGIANQVTAAVTISVREGVVLAVSSPKQPSAPDDARGVAP